MKASLLNLFAVASIVIAIFLNLNCTKNDNPVEPSNSRPVATIVGLAANASFLAGDTITFTATAVDQEDGELNDSLLVWASSVDGIFGHGLTCQIDTLTIGTHLIIFGATDTDGAVGADTATVIITENHIPVVIITGPTDSLIYNYRDSITFSGSSTDDEDGVLTGNALVWASDIDGQIGTGDTLVWDSLSTGLHLITLTATDSDNNSVTADISIEVINTFEMTYGGNLWNDAKSICATSDGGYITAGGTLNGSHGAYDAYLVKVDSVGNFVWENDLGGSYFDWAYSISQTAGGYIVAGYTGITSGTTGRDLYIIKTDESGNAIWERNFGGSNQDVGYSVCEVSSGGYIVAGMSCRDNYIADLYLVKTDVNGVLEWEKTYGLEDENEIAKAVLETSDGGFIIAGYKQDPGGYYDLYLLKTDDTGAVVWDTSYGGATYDMASSLSETSDGGYIVTGHTDAKGAGDKDVWLLKIDNSGGLIWDKTFGDIREDIGSSACETTDGGFIICGYKDAYGPTDKNVYLIKTDNTGNLVWERTFGGEIRDWGNSVLQTSDGGYIVGGASDSWGAGGNYDVYLIKTDSLGYVY